MTKELHVLHVLNSAHGGSAISTLEMIDELKRRGIRSSLICFNNADQRRQKEIAERLEGRALFIPLYWMNKRIRAAWWKRPLLEVMTVWKTWRGHRFQRVIDDFIRTQGINLIHTSTILNPEGAIAARRNGIPHLWHVRELVGPDKHFQFYNYSAWARKVSKGCYRLIANSQVTMQCLQQYFPTEKIVYIPNGIDVTGFAVKTHKPSDNLVVGMVGSVTTRWKNHALFIDVASLFADQPRIEFRIYGALPGDDDDYYLSLKGMIEGSRKKPKVTFMNFSRRPSDIMGEIDVLFHPTHFESFGRIYVEALAAGIPVVAPDEGGALEMVRDGENGFLFKTGDYQHAAQKIEQLAGSAALRNQFGTNGRDLAEREYTLGLLGQRIERIYRDALNEFANKLA